MSPQHVDPEEALKIHLEIKSKQSYAIHWGTFPMANEVQNSYNLKNISNLKIIFVVLHI